MIYAMYCNILFYDYIFKLSYHYLIIILTMSHMT